MKEKLWFLYVDSITEKWSGACEIMDNARNISLNCFCELGNYNEEAIKKVVEEIEQQSFNNIDRDLNKQGIMIELIEIRLFKLKQRIDNGEFDAPELA